MGKSKAKPSVLVTGGGNGIGFYLVEALLADGCRVGVLDIEMENLRGLAERFPARLNCYRCDLRLEAEVETAVEAFAWKAGCIDILVNNACLCHFKGFEVRTAEETRQEFEVNYFGALRAIRAVLPHMRRQGTGLIHNVSSGVGLTGFPGISGYVSTKAALEGLTRSLALELRGSGIAVNLIHPPLTDTASARPLGIPAEMMADPRAVGRGLAKKIASRKKVIAPDGMTALATFAAYKMPYLLGGLLAKMSAGIERKSEPGA